MISSDALGWRRTMVRHLAWLALLSSGLFAALIGSQFLTQWIVSRLGSHGKAVFVIFSMAAIVAFLALYTILVRRVEMRPVNELWGRPVTKELLTGLIIGAAVFGALMLILWSAGIAHISFERTRGFPVIALASAALAGVSEELVFRGALYRLLQSSFGSLTALIVSSLLFGALHALNPGSTPASSLAVALEAGVLLGMAYTATGSLWVAIGLHFGWDFWESAVFGALESGVGHHGWLQTQMTGPNYLSGGTFGPEGSIIAIPICLSAAAIFFGMAVRSNRWIRSPRIRTPR